MSVSASNGRTLPERVEPIPVGFMLSSINGRNQLEGGARRVVHQRCNLCRSAPEAEFKCLQCGLMCGVCMRTMCSHDRGRGVYELVTSPAATNMPAQSFCNSCGMRPLPVPYYHCMVCPDYDHCPACEEINDGIEAMGDTSTRPRHDPAHPMIKYRGPHSWRV
jgi:hypothetical protein